MAECGGAFHEQPVIAGRDADRPIRGFKRLVRHQQGAAGAVAFRQLAGVFVAVDRAFHPGDRGLEQRGVDHAALPGALALLQGGKRADDAPHAGSLVVDRRRAEGRRVFRPAGHGHHRAIGLQQRVEPRRQPQRAGIAEGPDGAVDQPRIDRQQRLRPDADIVDNAGTQVLDQDIRGFHQLFQPGDVVGGFDIHRNRPLVAVLRMEEQRIPLHERRAPEPGVVAAIRLFHLDHISAHIGQDGTGQRAGQRLADFDHADSVERSGHRPMPAGRSRRSCRRR